MVLKATDTGADQVCREGWCSVERTNRYASGRLYPIQDVDVTKGPERGSAMPEEESEDDSSEQGPLLNGPGQHLSEHAHVVARRRDTTYLEMVIRAPESSNFNRQRKSSVS